ncbi:hypothetical protein [Thalassospira povalilytica]|uniref:hypothetical protein n=1 Tax=Thalassospira povalilytica TaxID=732237 RepID=UPI003AA91163
MSNNQAGTNFGKPVVSTTKETPEFIEDLPDNCPPDDAQNPEEQYVLRLVSGTDITSEDFFSHAKLGKERPENCCSCKWSSCSVFALPKGNHRTIAHMKLPKLRDRKFAAKLKVFPQSGLVKESKSKNGHLDFWMFSTFNPIDHIEAVVAL